MSSNPSVQKKKSKMDGVSSSATAEISKYIAGQQQASEELEQAMYIQIEEQEYERKKETKRMKLVKQKVDPSSKSPRPRRIASNEGQISDVSDVEPAPQTGHAMLKLQLKFENLEDILERFQNQIINHGSAISELQSNSLTKTSQRQLGQYFERISMGVHKEVGEKSHKYKLDDPSFINEETLSPDGQALKHSVEGFIDKLDVISQAIIRNKKF